ncbi:TetR/AcrR family transcriptional regulator [Amycolatopsis acidiphila]|nr:TetR/AcrR family transcriptional regulator [Amycolatopsis acidiphila]UIJ59252.1 TetR/AcrR family transcriptional regulator [Amycolatopsis acidiphila]GHG79341.1 TetR family transcriptional regulator [Amycolatopsis acidiphila]
MTQGRRAAQRERMRARLLAAALELFGKYGYDATTIDQIAAKADVARQTVLNHYPHKRDFMRAWGQDRRDQLLRLPEVDGTEPAAEQLRRYFAALAAMNEQERELTGMLRASLRHDEVLVQEKPVPQAVLTAIRRGQARGEFDPGAEPELVAEVLAAIYSDTLSRWLIPAERPFDLAKLLAVKLDLVLRGLVAR